MLREGSREKLREVLREGERRESERGRGKKGERREIATTVEDLHEL